MVPRPRRCTLRPTPSEPQISRGEASCSKTDLSTPTVTPALDDICTCKYCLWYRVFTIASSFSLHCSLSRTLKFLLRILRQIYLVRAIRTYCMMRTENYHVQLTSYFLILLRSLCGILLNFQWQRKCIWESLTLSVMLLFKIPLDSKQLYSICLKVIFICKSYNFDCCPKFVSIVK